MDKNRRNFLRRSAIVGTGFLTAKTVSAQHEHHTQPKPQAPKKSAPPQPQAPPKAGKVSAPAGNVPVITPDLPKLPWTMENGVKVFHLSADVVKREFLPAAPWGPAKVVDVWGYNGSMPGPTIEVNEGDRVRIMFHDNPLARA
jgi:FtsP/CotA-like multicopper oxidase with cupredoxin domain